MENSIGFGFGISIIVPDKCFKLVILLPPMHGQYSCIFNKYQSNLLLETKKLFYQQCCFVIQKYNYLLFVLMYVLINFLLCVLYCMVHCFSFRSLFHHIHGLCCWANLWHCTTTITSCLKLLTIRPNGLAVNLSNLRKQVFYYLYRFLVGNKSHILNLKIIG